MAARALDGSGPPELRHLTGSFNVMAANVEKLVQRQRNFLADASHQLRNPLSALLLRLDSLTLGAPEDPAVEAAARDGRHLAGILERLLELANADETHARLELVDLGRLADERIDAWSTAAHAKGMTLERSGAAQAEIVADPVAVASALDVVLDNAIKFAPRDSTVQIEVSGEALTVRDEGPGMRADELRRAGDRFWRARRHQNVDGSGLGLAIARALLERSGGELELKRRRPRGLEACLRFGGAKPVERGRMQRNGRGLDRGAAVERGGGGDGAGDRPAALE
jgi:signal transduction histidine kinase